MIPCILFEDEHLVVIKKPAGINTHRPSPYTTDGIYDWLKNQNPRYYNLSTLHRLDKETSGILIFGKTPEANRSLTNQFAKRKNSVSTKLPKKSLNSSTSTKMANSITKK